jgi:ketosteroid isomerase-like protein
VSAEEPVIAQVVERWERFLSGDLPEGLAGLLADDVVFYSPIVYTPQRGRDVTTLYLQAAAQTLPGEGDAAFRYTKKVLAGDLAVLEFETSLDGKHVNGVDILRCDEGGRIVEFRVMLRPLQAVHAVHEAMGRMLASMPPTSAARPLRSPA